MAIKFPSPKSTFQAFKSAFGSKSAQRPEAGAAGPSPRTPHASDLPRRHPSPSARQAAPPPRQAAPRRPAGVPGYGRAQTAPPAGTARPPSQGEKLLQTLTLLHLDRMRHDQLAEVVAFLEGRQEPGAAAKLAQLTLPFQRNWQLLRSTFNDSELQTLIARRPLEVLAMLKRPAPRADAKPAPGARPETKPAGAPAPGPGARHQWNQTPPRTPAGSTEARPTKPGKPPVSVLGLGRQAAIAELKERGVKPAELKAMGEAFSDYANFGGEQLAADFKKTYGHLVADDITDSASRARLALFFKGLARESPDA